MDSKSKSIELLNPELRLTCKPLSLHNDPRWNNYS